MKLMETVEKRISAHFLKRFGYSEKKGFRTGFSELNSRLSRLKDIFFELVRIPSESGKDMEEVLGYINKFFSPYESLGVQYERIENQNFAEVFIPGKGEETVICAHLDTVMPGDSIIPFVASTQGGPVLRSRGNQILASDNKIAVAAILAESERILKKRKKHRPLRLIFTTDEETSGQQIKNVEPKGSKGGLILDYADEPGIVVLGGYGYSRFDASLDCSDIEALQYIADLTIGIGSHLVGRRMENNELLIPRLREGIGLNTIDEITIGKKETGEEISRNTVPEDGYILGSFSFTDKDILNNYLGDLSTALNLVEGSLDFVVEDSICRFKVNFKGQAGHARLYEGVTTVLSGLALFANAILPEPSQENEILSKQEVRLNIARIITTNSDHAFHNFQVIGEARYKESEDAQEVLKKMQTMTEKSKGQMKFVEENKAYQLEEQNPIVRRLIRILRRHRIKVKIIELSTSMSDANNTPIPMVVTSEGTRNAHSSKEEFPMGYARDLLNIVHDWMTL